MNRSTLLAAAAVLAGCLALSACEGETVCDYVEPTPPTGDFLDDLTGCWQAPGIYVLGQDPYREVVFQFSGVEVQEGTGVYRWREIQAPNSLYAGGNVFQYAYSLDRANFPDGGVMIEEQDGTIFAETEKLDLGGIVTTVSYDQGLPHATATITPTSLLLDYYFLDTKTSIFGQAQPFRRAICRGFGFDSAENACPRPAAAQQ